jgi:hypothetical protein
MIALVTLLAAAVVVLVPGLAAAFWITRTTGRGAGPGLATSIAGVFAGIGLAALSLWLAAGLVGLSRWTAVAAPLAVAATVAVTAPRRPRGAPGAVAEEAPVRGARATLVALSLASVMLVAVPFAPYGLQRADGVHRMAMSDWGKHLMMTTAIAASPAFPPPHPYIHSDRQASYYFGYHLVAAAISTLSGGPHGIFTSLFILTLATAAAAPFVVYVFSRDLCGHRQALLAAGASSLLVGFDVVVLAIDTVRSMVAAWPLPEGLSGLRAIIPSTHIDYWIHNVDRSFSAPIIATMWSPHQVAATLIALLVLWLLAPHPDDAAQRRAGWFLPALLIASLAALSSYIAMGLAVGVAGAAVAETLSHRQALWRTTVFRRWALPGVVGVLLALPTYPTVLRGSSSGLLFHISSAGTWVNGALFSSLFGAYQWTGLLDTPALYAVELGVVGLLGVLQIVHLRRQRGLTPVEQQAAAVAASVLLLLTFVRPPIGVGNNLYARALLLTWFVLAPFAAGAALRFAKRRSVAVAALVCALGTAYAEVGYLLQGSLFWSTPTADVEALRWVNDHTPAHAVVAIHPDDYENNHAYWLRRPLVLGDERLAVLFGARPAHYARTAASLEAAYAEADPERARQDFAALEADVILVRSAGPDPAWMSPACFDVSRPNPTWSVAVRRTSCDR